MAVESGTYDQATVARHQKIAEAMWNDAFKPKPIRHWAEGVSQLAETGLAGYLGNKADAEAKGLKAQDTAALASLLGGSSATPAASPVSPEPSAVPTTPPGGAPMAAAPMGNAVASAMSPAGPPVNIPRPEVTPTAKVWGDKEAEDAGLYEKSAAGPGVKVAAALGGNAPMPAPAPVAPTAAPSGGLLANATPQQKAAIAAGIGASPDSPANKIAMAMITAQVAQENKNPVSVAKGGTLVDPRTGKVVFKAPTEDDEKPKWGIVGKDKYGQPVYGYPPTRTEAAAKGSEKPAAPEADMAGITGKDYLDTLKKDDPKMESQVRAVLEGRAPYPTGMLLKTPYGQQLAAHVTQADPSFESGNATARVKTRNEFMTGGVGSPAGQITAGNTALQHAGEMSDALERMKEGGGILRGLGNAGLPIVSYGANALKNKSVQGTPEGAALNDFMTAKNHFSEEVTKFYAGSAGSEAERTRALANLDAAKSLPELRSAIKTEVNLMQGKVNALQDRWRNGMGPLVPEFPLIQSKSQEAIDRVIQRHQASEQPAAGAPAVQTATNPKTGEKIMLKDGQWVPVK